MKAVLAGNPNAGKTTLFNALTNSRLSTGNWHGVTTRPYYKTVKGVTFADVPGMYSFDGYSMEEASAAQEIKSADVVVNVVDSLTLESALLLTRRIISMNKRAVVYVTKLKTLKRRGGRLNKNKLSLYLGVPVVSTVKELKALLNSGVPFAVAPLYKMSLDQAYYGGNCNLSRACYFAHIRPSFSQGQRRMRKGVFAFFHKWYSCSIAMYANADNRRHMPYINSACRYSYDAYTRPCRV